jgi:enamine deaminase RidA (YjgF/YER057c/UK114 family)
MTQRQRIASGTKWEAIAGYSRAVRVGNVVYVAGTTATDENGDIVGAGDPGAQTAYILQKIGGALNAAGASLDDVVRTRIYITRVDDWEPVAREHGRIFEQIRPANTLVAVAALIGSEYLVEIEAEAVIDATGPESNA